MFKEFKSTVLRKFFKEHIILTNTPLVKFYPPKLALIKETCVLIIDIENRIGAENGSEIDCQHETEFNILDAFLQEHLLWLILDTSRLVVIDLLSGSKIQITNDDLYDYKIAKFRTNGVNLYLLSESEECLMVNSSVQAMLSKLKEGAREFPISLEKIRSYRNLLKKQSIYNNIDCNENVTGLQLDVERGALIVQCPYTELRAVALSLDTCKWNYVLPWGEMAVLADNANIWIVRLCDTQVQLELKADEGFCWPLVTHGNSFYYLMSDKKEFSIHQIEKASQWLEELQTTTTSDVQQFQIQASLKSQLVLLVDTVINDNSFSTDILKQLQLLFNDIDDASYLLNNGIKLCKYNIEFKPLLDSLRMKISPQDNIMKEITNVIFKVEILECLKVFSLNHKYDKSHIFQSNFMNLCVEFVSNSDLDLASIMWLKYSRIEKKLMAQDVTAIFNATPHNIKINSLIFWFKNFIPSLLYENPFFIDLIVKWTTDRVFLLEKSTYWPKIGIKFIDEMISVLEASQRNFITIRPTSMDDLDMLKVHISKILELKEKYKINMLLSELSCQSPREVALIMLHRCYTEDLKVFLCNYLSIFATEYSLDLDDILRSYVERETLDNGGGADDERLHVILDAFSTSTQRLDCLLEILRTVEVPWSTAIHELAINSVANKDDYFAISEADQQLYYEIKMELNVANLKVVLKKYNFPLNCTDYLLVLNKLSTAPIIDLSDLKTVIKLMNNYQHYGSMLYIDRCLRDCAVKKALLYFKTLNEKEKSLLLKSVMTKYECIINDDTNNSVTERSYLDFIKESQLLNEIRMSKMEDMYHLKNSYNIKVGMNDMSCEKVRVHHILDWFSSSRESASSGHGICITQLARLPYTFDTVLINLLSQSNASTEVQNVIENLLEMFLKNKFTYKEIETIMINFKDYESHTIENCCTVLIQMINNCPEEYLHPLVSILCILNGIVNTLLKLKNLRTAWKFHYIFIPMATISSSDALIENYVNILSQKMFDNNQLKNISDKSFIAFRILSSYTYSHILINSFPDNSFIEAKKHLAKNLMTKILLSQEFDELLLASLLLLLNCNSTIEGTYSDVMSELFNALDGHDETESLLSKYVSSSVVRRAIGINNVSQINTSPRTPQNILKAKYNLNLADLALPDITEETWDAKLVLFYFLKNYPNLSIEKVVDFSQTLNINVDDGLSLQLISYLVNWDLKYKCITDEFKHRQIIYENDENQLISDCLLIWESIKDKTFLIDVLKDFWKNGEVSLQGRLISVNPYHYEVYLCIYKLINNQTTDCTDRKQYFLLHFLKEYKRLSSPKQFEFELFSIKGMFPEIGHYRLPFQLFMREDMWSNLKSEITLASYEQWLPMAAILCLDTDLQTARDMLCSNALKQTMTERKRINDIRTNESQAESWRLEAKEEPLLRAAHHCVRHIANMEWAGACLFYVLQGCARGADQVAAAQLCYHFAERWAAIQPVNRAVRQMQKLHCTLSTRHALHKINWACEDLLQFCAEPMQLVRAIYFHPDYINKMTRYNVNKTIDDIADKNNINISAIRIQILENILEQNNEKKNNEDIIRLDNAELMRAKCILKATCPKMGAMYLARIALDNDSDFNKKKKLRALQCLISIVDSDTALKVTNKNRETLWSTLVELFFAIRLENVDMPWAISILAKDTVRTLEQVCFNSENRPEVLRLTTELVQRYGCEQNIKDILHRLLTASMYDELLVLLCNTLIGPDEFIRKVWSAAILAPFKHADYPITERQRYNCLKTVNILPLCPYISDEDLKIIWKNCLRCKCIAIGCLILPYMSPEAQKSLSELQKIDKRNLIAGIKNLQTESYLVNGALSVLESIVTRRIR